MEQPLTIDNVQNYPSEVVDQLEKLLVEGVSARPDPRRRNEGISMMSNMLIEPFSFMSLR